MAGNRYKIQGDLYDLIEEEDRECDNDLKRAKTEYYNTLTSINKRLLAVLNDMDNSEIRNTLLYDKVVKRIE